MSTAQADLTVLVTGGTSGIGKAVAEKLAAKGCMVLATSRNPDRLTPADRIPSVRYLRLDLADPRGPEALAEELDELGVLDDIDVLVNNAGESQSGPFEELPAEAIERLFRTNVFGPVRLSQLVLPGMRNRRQGRIIMVGSMLASFPLAHRSSYSAAKAALRAFATAARQELSPFGVWVSTVEPGSIATGIGLRRTKYLDEGSPYTADVTTMLEHLDANERGGIPAEKVASTIVDAIVAPRPREFYAVGSRAPLPFLLKRVLPRSLMSKIVAAQHGLKR
ncbi:MULTISPECIES: SDR family NAD(P)-dependent oxidoreductase [unclassified Brevibacterium]|uniref:SDR family NAD(P)-dependent oxidoreductase n=1 Tax=unclassified Brevibacterium TaxID=2614124 RepID=UPI001092B6AE|nr:SDR family NAD(P)-dependent oxidoreductase [Brevibacterium sp. S22]TGD31588.1 SDR family NAD(P)-dependent oxidoreductase [Brevibacterium sp. S22]